MFRGNIANFRLCLNKTFEVRRVNWLRRSCMVHDVSLFWIGRCRKEKRKMCYTVRKYKDGLGGGGNNLQNRKWVELSKACLIV